MLSVHSLNKLLAYCQNFQATEINKIIKLLRLEYVGFKQISKKLSNFGSYTG